MGLSYILVILPLALSYNVFFFQVEHAYEVLYRFLGSEMCFKSRPRPPLYLPLYSPEKHGACEGEAAAGAGEAAVAAAAAQRWWQWWQG